MPSNQPAPQAWQHTGAPPPASESVPSWRQNAAAPDAGSWIPTRRFGIGLTWFAFLFFCTSLVWVATWVSPPKTVALLLIGAGYEDNPVFPANSAGQNTLRDLAAFAKKPVAGN